MHNRSWDDCSPDQLRVAACNLLSLLTQATHLLDIRTVSIQKFFQDSTNEEVCVRKFFMRRTHSSFYAVKVGSFQLVSVFIID